MSIANWGCFWLGRFTLGCFMTSSELIDCLDLTKLYYELLRLVDLLLLEFSCAHFLFLGLSLPPSFDVQQTILLIKCYFKSGFPRKTKNGIVFFQFFKLHSSFLFPRFCSTGLWINHIVFWGRWVQLLSFNLRSSRSQHKLLSGVWKNSLIYLYECLEFVYRGLRYRDNRIILVSGISLTKPSIKRLRVLERLSWLEGFLMAICSLIIVCQQTRWHWVGLGYHWSKAWRRLWRRGYLLILFVWNRKVQSRIWRW